MLWNGLKLAIMVSPHKALHWLLCKL